TAHPALVRAGDRGALRVFAAPREQARHMPAGVRQLLLLDTPSPEGYVLARLSEEAKLALVRNPHGGVRELLADCAACAVDALVAEHGGPPWDEAGYADLRRKVRASLNRATLGVVTEVLPVLNLAGELAPRLRAAAARYPEAVADMRAQLDGLVRPGFVTDTGWQRLPDLARYLTALRRRLDQLPSQPDRDRPAMAQVPAAREAYRLLPHRERRMVGAWCFVDHFVPDDVAGTPGMRIPPHPHTGLQTVTWLLEGEILHRDSLGNVTTARPGQLNIMTAGFGISHSEESPVDHPPVMHGLQLWAALPDATRNGPPAFSHHPELPVRRDGDATITVVAGEIAGERSPAQVHTPLVAAEIRLDGTARLPLEPDFEYGMLVLTGTADVGGTPL